MDEWMIDIDKYYVIFDYVLENSLKNKTVVINFNNFITNMLSFIMI